MSETRIRLGERVAESVGVHRQTIANSHPELDLGPANHTFERDDEDNLRDALTGLPSFECLERTFAASATATPPTTISTVWFDLNIWVGAATPPQDGYHLNDLLDAARLRQSARTYRAVADTQLVH